MKKLLLLTLTLFLLATTVVDGQKITLKIMNGSSLQPIEGAVIHSTSIKNNKLTSDKFGHITLTLIENDTITILKDYFHPIYLFVKMKNFDSTHVLSINMVPSKDIHEPIKGNFTSLSDFEYHFVHDQVSNDSHVKVNGYEHPDATQRRTELMHSKTDPNGFHITPSVHHQHTGTNLYKLKE